MQQFVVDFLQRVALSAVEGAVGAVVGAAFRPRVPPPPPSSPTEEAVLAMDTFLRAVAARDFDLLATVCDPLWEAKPETAELMDGTLAADPPLSWRVNEVLVPEGWQEGQPLPWVVAEIDVTFGTVESGSVTVPAVMRTTQHPEGWMLDHLEWGEAPAAEPEPEPAAAFPFPYAIFGEPPEAAWPAYAVLACPRCGQKLRVPGDRGRLRVTCPRCSNVQWYVPGGA